jgi:uncharacterized protein YgbK (DUF1537 family)
MPLVTEGSGLAAGLAGLDPHNANDTAAAKSAGRPKSAKTVVLSGSCSQATNRQVNLYKKQVDSLGIDVHRCLHDLEDPKQVLK